MDFKEVSEFAASLDRAYFIDNENKAWACLNQPLPIGFGQTISQPSLVVEMSHMLDMAKDRTVLEIGTGSGYQTAILAHFSKHVYTVERIPELAESARKRLDALGYTNISYRVGDGSSGWKEHAPFDRIIVTAAAGHMPQDLLDQLKENGILLAPIGPPSMQELILARKGAGGEVRISSTGYVRFVELKGKYGWQNDEPLFDDSMLYP